MIGPACQAPAAKKAKMEIKEEDEPNMEIKKVAVEVCEEEIQLAMAGMELEVELPEKEFPDQEHDYGVDMVLLPDEQPAEESQVLCNGL